MAKARHAGLGKTGKCALAAILMLLHFAGPLFAGDRSPRVIILGFDGLDPRLCRQWMSEDRLPNLKHLAEEGSFHELATTYPCQSPVAWRTFATGVNPGGHGVFDFLRKIPGTYLPTTSTVEVSSLALLPGWRRIGIGLIAGMVVLLGVLRALRNRRRRWRLPCAGVAGLGVAALAVGTLYAWVPRTIPLPVNRTGGTPFWKYLGEQGLRCVALRVPVEFPARQYRNARVFSGLGVPDIRGSNGTYTIFTTEAGVIQDSDTEMGGRIVPLIFSDGVAETRLAGPIDVLHGKGQRLAVPMKLTRREESLTAEVCGNSINLQEGQWSEWVPLSFSASPLVSVHGMGRFLLLMLTPDVKLYFSAVNFDPKVLPPNIRLSAPARYAPDLRDRNGFFKTLGWPTDTWALTEEHITDDDYLADYRYTMRREKEVTLAELDRGEWDCFCAVFTPTDQIQHVFYRYLDPQHPLYDASAPDAVRNAIRGAYEEADAFVGLVMKEYIDDRTALVVLSDHGFHSFRTAVNLNTWLWRNGYIKLKSETPYTQERKLEELYTGSDVFWQSVDWSGTYAYSMGLGGIYLNLEGREPQGIVRPGEMANLILRKLKEGLSSLTDPANGEPVVRSVYFGRDLYHGPYTPEAPDVVVGFHPGYRVSWQTALGGIPPDIFEANDRKWSGDHCSFDPAVTPGVLFTNRELRDGDVSILDAAPSILAALSCQVPGDMEGRPWWR